MIRIVTACTPGDYARIALDLCRSVSDYGIPMHIHNYHDRGSWAANCAIKPEAILCAMDVSHGDDCLWLDADMTITSWPGSFPDGDVLLKYGEPLPVHYDFALDRIVKNTERVNTPWAGHGLYRCTDETRVMLSRWRDIMRQYGDRVGDEQCLRLALERTPGCIVGPLDTSFIQHAVVGYDHGKPVTAETPEGAWL